MGGPRSLYPYTSNPLLDLPLVLLYHLHQPIIQYPIQLLFLVNTMETKQVDITTIQLLKASGQGLLELLHIRKGLHLTRIIPSLRAISTKTHQLLWLHGSDGDVYVLPSSGACVGTYLSLYDHVLAIVSFQCLPVLQFRASIPTCCQSSWPPPPRPSGTVSHSRARGGHHASTKARPL